MKRFLYWIWLSLRLGEGNAKFTALLEKFGTPEAIYDASAEELATFAGEFGNDTVRALSDKKLDGAYEIETYCGGHGISIWPYHSDEYPKLLRTLKNPPVLLYARGKKADLGSRVCIGVVGTRSISEYGRQTAYRIGYELAVAGAVVVSGLALGVDSVAACGALDAGGYTVAVLGSGLDCIYPASHKKLAKQIAEHGLLLSEYPPLSTPTKFTFPMRNRIISGLCQGTTVVEAGVHSGALITARDAIMQGRDVFALPGNVNEESAMGTNLLIRDGAQAVTCAADILAGYKFLYQNSLHVQELSRTNLKSTLTPGRLRAHGVKEEEPVEVKTPENKNEQSGGILGDLLHKAKKVSGETVKELSGTREYPEYDQNNPEVIPGKTQPDNSVAVLAKLDEDTRKIFEAMPIGKPISADALSRQGFNISKIMVAFTLLELNDLATPFPGGQYIRK